MYQKKKDKRGFDFEILLQRQIGAWYLTNPRWQGWWWMQSSSGNCSMPYGQVRPTPWCYRRVTGKVSECTVRSVWWRTSSCRTPASSTGNPVRSGYGFPVHTATYLPSRWCRFPCCTVLYIWRIVTLSFIKNNPISFTCSLK